jgi:hypothetical protein
MARAKKKPSSVENTAREDVHKKAEEIIEESQSESEPASTVIEIKLPPYRLHQLQVLAKLNDDTPAEYAKKVLSQYIVDRLYLVK